MPKKPCYLIEYDDGSGFRSAGWNTKPKKPLEPHYGPVLRWRYRLHDDAFGQPIAPWVDGK